VKRIRIGSSGAVGRITLARPEKRNALDELAAEELARALGQLDADPSVRVVLLDADGEDFCAGADLAALEDMLEAGADAHRRDADALGHVFTTMREMS